MNTPKASYTSLKKIQILISALFIITIPLLCWAGWHVLRNVHDSGWIMLAVLALTTVSFTIFLPSIAMVFAGETYLIAIAIMYGPSPCVLSAACCALMMVLGVRLPGIHRQVFNFSSMVCGAFLYSMVYQLVSPAHIGIDSLLPYALLMAIVSFLFSSLLLAVAVSQEHGRGVLTFWARAYLPLLLNSFISAAGAMVIVATYGFNRYTPILAYFAVVLIWIWTRLIRKRLMREVAASPEQSVSFLSGRKNARPN